MVSALGALLLAAWPALAGNCISEKAVKSLTCTANDIRIAFADNPRDVNGTPITKCIKDQTFSFVADFHVVTSATSRYDIGLWFATDGDANADGALSGRARST